MMEYLKKYKFHVFWAGLFVLLVHGAKLNSPAVGIDTEDLIHLGTEFYDGWLNTGRQGLVFLKYITGSVVYNPYFAGLFTLVAFAVAVTGFMMLWDCAVGRDSRIGGGVLCGSMLLWIAHPILVEQFYFTLQGAEIGIGMALTALALGAILWAQEKGGKKRWIAYLVSGLLLLLTFSIYQIFVVLFIFGAVTVLLLQTIREGHPKQGFTGVVKEVLPYASTFLGAFLCNTVITKVFFSESEYLSNQIRWGELSVRDCIYSIAVHGRDVFTGQNSIFYSWVFGVLCLIGLVVALMLVKKQGWGLIFYYVALLTTPFLMTVVCADVPAIRSQLILPAMTGFVLYVDVLMMKSLQRSEKTAKRKGAFGPIYALLAVLAIFGSLWEIQISLRLYYTDACRYAEDEALGRALIVQLEDLIGQDGTPIIVIGSRAFRGNNACIEGEIIGRSIFEHDVEEEPRYYWSTRRIVGFLHTLGYDCEQLSDKNISYAEDFAVDMDPWPDDDSVIHAGDMIIIKLSEE